MQMSRHILLISLILAIAVMDRLMELLLKLTVKVFHFATDNRIRPISAFPLRNRYDYDRL